VYGVATISMLLKIINLFGRISSGSFAKKVYDFKEPTNRSHPIVVIWHSVSNAIIPWYRLFYRALLQNRPMILRSLLIVATP